MVWPVRCFLLSLLFIANTLKIHSCKQAKPEFIKFAKQSHGIFQVGAVDCDVNKKLCQHYRVQGFPTIVTLLPGEREQPKPFQGERTAQAMYAFAEQQLPSSLVRITKQEPKQCSKFCIVLLSDKSTPTALFKALALRFNKRAELYQVVTSKAKRQQQPEQALFGSKETAIPALFVGGNLQYTGKMRLDDITAYVEQVMAKKQQRDGL